MRPVASSRRRHASAQRRDPQSKLGSLNAEQRLDLQTLKMQLTYGDCLATALDATPEDFLEAEKLLDTVERRYRRIFGENHPFTTQCQDRLRRARVMAHNARVMAEQFG